MAFRQLSVKVKLAQSNYFSEGATEDLSVTV